MMHRPVPKVFRAILLAVVTAGFHPAAGPGGACGLAAAQPIARRPLRRVHLLPSLNLPCNSLDGYAYEPIV